jgi:tetratricopeptide (TPR) repeat protein
MSNHLNDETMAMIIDQGLDSVDQDVRDHLALCPKCLSTYEEAVVIQTRWIDGFDESDVPHHSIRDALSIAQTSQSKKQTHQPILRFWRPALITLGAAAVLLLGFINLYDADSISTQLRNDTAPAAALASLDAETINTISSAIVNASQRDLILPGAENSTLADEPVYRGGFTSDQDQLSQALSNASEQYLSGDTDLDLAVLLIGGEIASGQLENARTLLNGAQRRNTNDLRLKLLSGIVSYHQNDLAAAESVFQEVILADPDNMIALFNLGFILPELNQRAAGRALMESVVETGTGNLIRARAETELTHQ